MAWDSNSQVLSLPFTKIAADGQGDLQKALGRTAIYSEVALIRDIDPTTSARVYKTNKWAKYKPVAKAGQTFASQMNSDYTWKDSADWWKGDDGRCGMTFAVYGSLGTGAMSSNGQFFHDLLQGLEWAYTPPTGTSQQPLRPYDFNQYFAAALKPVEGVADAYQLTEGGVLSVQLVVNRGYDGRTLWLSDFTVNNVSVADMYIGCLVWRSNSIFTFVTGGKVGDGDLTCTFTGMESNYGGRDVTIVPFLSSRAITQGSDPGSGIYLSVDVLPKSVRINSYTTQYVTSMDEAQWRESMHVRVHYSVRLHNNTASAKSVATITIALYRSDRAQALDSWTVSNQSVPANGYVDLEGTFLPQVAYSDSYTYTVVVTSTGNVWAGTKEVDDYRG